MATQFAEGIVGILKNAFSGPLGLHEPFFGGREWEHVKECLDSGWVSSTGRFVEQFESRLAQYTGARYAIATVNGTAALHVCLKLARISVSDEVLLPALTFVATANAVSYCGAIPHFVDSDYQTLGVDPVKLRSYLEKIADVRSLGCFNRRTGRRMAALIVMHTYGHPADLDSINAVCRDFRLELIEDAAESLGSFYKGRHTGNCGRLAVLSFNGNKIVTTGGGGAILTNDEHMAKIAKHLTTTAKKSHPWEFDHDHVGFNYRLPNINAALGCAQLEQLPSFLDRKRSLANFYSQLFGHVEGITFFREPLFAKSNYWLNLLVLDPEFASERDALLTLARENQIAMRPAWIPMHRLPMYRNCPKMDLSVTEDLYGRLINIPSSVCLGVACV